MTPLLLALTMLLGSPLPALQDGAVETTFHRVHLRNGNFIDGKVIADKPNEVIMTLKSGEMAIRRDLVDRIEIVRMKSFNDKAIILATPKNPNLPATTEVKNTPPATVETSEQIKKKIDGIIFQYKTSNAGEKEFPLAEIQPLGDEGLAYMCTKAPMFDSKMLDSLAVLLIGLKPDPASKTAEVLSSLVSNEKAQVRAMAGTALVYTGGAAAKAKYLKPLLKDPDPRVRETALGLLGNTEDGDWFELMAELSADTDKEVRNRALRNARAIMQKNGWQERFIRALVQNFSHPDPTVRSDSAAMIGVMGVKEAWPHLAGLLVDPEASVRATAAQGLMTLSAEESGEAVVRALPRESDRWARVYLAAAAQRLKLMGAADALVEWLSSPEEEIRKAAESALRAITGLNFGYDTAKWTEWNNSRKR